MSEELFEIITRAFFFAIAWLVMLATIMYMVLRSKPTDVDSPTEIKRSPNMINKNSPVGNEQNEGELKMEVNIKMFDIFRSNVVEWIIDMLVSDEIMLNDIPVQIRTSCVSSKSIYISALRISNQISCRRFIRDLEILSSDILFVKDEQYQDELIRVLWDYLNMNDHKGEKSFEAFKENINKEILCKLQRKYRIDKEKLQAQLRKYKLEKKR